VVATLATAGAVVGAFVGFSKPKKPADGLLGLAHGAVHLAAAFTATGALGRQTRGWRSLGGRRATVVGGAAAAGGAVGPALFALSLIVADGLGLFGRNTNELYSAMAIEDHKGFLRLHVGADGLTIYPIKVDDVAHWSPDGTWDKPPGAPRFRPDRAPVPTLIEAPIEVTRQP
jgi:hypothetical protein